MKVQYLLPDEIAVVHNGMWVGSKVAESRGVLGLWTTPYNKEYNKKEGSHLMAPFNRGNHKFKITNIQLCHKTF